MSEGLPLLYIISVAIGFFSLRTVPIKYVCPGWFYFSSNNIFFSFPLSFVACNLLDLQNYFP